MSMSSIIYSSIPDLAYKIKLGLSEEELKELIQEIFRGDIQKFSEYRDSIAYGTYAPVSKVCSTCGRPL